jgi:glutamate racemase
MKDKNKDMPIGLFDSGIGGLSVLKQFIRFLPYERYIYLGDTARVPYGNKSAETVQEYSRQCTQFLLDKGVKLVVVACNTASSLALEQVKQTSDVPVVDMISPVAGAALRATHNGRIGVIGTRATISSDAYANAIKSLTKPDNVEVHSRACPLFVPIVEEGWIRHQASELIAKEYLEPFKSTDIDTLVLGCTHYPLLSELISKILPGIMLIDSGEHAAVNSIRTLAEMGVLAEERNEFLKNPQIEFFVSDVPSTFFDVAKRFLGFEVDKPQRVNIGQ